MVAVPVSVVQLDSEQEETEVVAVVLVPASPRLLEAQQCQGKGLQVEQTMVSVPIEVVAVAVQV